MARRPNVGLLCLRFEHARLSSICANVARSARCGLIFIGASVNSRTSAIPEFPSADRAPVTVAVVVPYHNDSVTVGRALDSLRAQTRLPDQVLIIDDAGTEAEHASLLGVVSELRGLNVQVIRRQTNGGPSAARNDGWEAADATHIAFLDADDSWVPTKLERQLRSFEENEDLALLGTRTRHGWDNPTSPMRESGSIRVSTVSPQAQLLRNRLSTSSVMLKADVEYRFNPDFRYSEDNDLWCRLLLGGNVGGILEEELTVYYKGIDSSEGASSRYVRMLRGQISVYRGLYRDEIISRRQCIAAIGSAYARFARRLMRVTWLRSSKSRSRI